MSYNNLIPQAADSPGIFPAQSQVNFTRLKTIIDADHQFNDSPASNDGYHNLIHMIPASPTGALAGIGRLYVKITSGVTQLFYRDDSGTEYQITPQYLVSPQKITGTGVVPAATPGPTPGELLIFPTPTYDYTGILTIYINNTSSTTSYAIMRSGANASSSIISAATIGLISAAYTGTDLKIFNLSGGAQTMVWSLMINRTT